MSKLCLYWTVYTNRAVYTNLKLILNNINIKYYINNKANNGIFNIIKEINKYII